MIVSSMLKAPVLMVSLKSRTISPICHAQTYSAKSAKRPPFSFAFPLSAEKKDPQILPAIPVDSPSSSLLKKEIGIWYVPSWPLPLPPGLPRIG